MRVGYISNLMIGEDTLGIRGKVWKEYYLETEHSKFSEDHYLIINLNNDNLKLKKGLNYYYDFSQEYNIEEVSENYKYLLMKVNPYIAVYLKIK